MRTSCIIPTRYYSLVFTAMSSSSRNTTGSLDEQRAWDRYFAYLIKTLADPDASARARAARILGENREPQAIGALTAVLMDDPDMNVRQHAAAALGRIGAVEPLLEALHTPNARVRQLVTQALGQLGDPRAVKPLIVALRDSSHDVRDQAAFALNKMGPVAVEPLIAALRHPDAIVRWSAARILGSVGDRRALPELERLAQEDNTPVVTKGHTGEFKSTRPLNTVAKAAQQAAEKIRERK